MTGTGTEQTGMREAYEWRGRNVRIDKGEAWFQVAKDKKRPFVVAAGDVRVRAVGTAFSVRRLEEGADVQVTEGVVEVFRPESFHNLFFVSVREFRPDAVLLRADQVTDNRVYAITVLA